MIWHHERSIYSWGSANLGPAMKCDLNGAPREHSAPAACLRAHCATLKSFLSPTSGNSTQKPCNCRADEVGRDTCFNVLGREPVAEPIRPPMGWCEGAG